jgi:signal transduction histidine kinase
MDPVTLVVSSAIAIAGLIVGIVIGRRSHADDIRQADREMRAARAELDDRERASREDRRIQDLILSTMQEGVLLLDHRQKTAIANDALARHLGARPGSLSQLFPVPAREAVRRAADDRRTTSVEVELGAPTRWLRVVATPAGDDGSVLVVANASHELKTPAAAILAAAETIGDAAADDPSAVVRFAAQLERDALRLSRIVMDLLDLSRLETGSDGLERVDVGHVAADEAERAAPAADDAGVSLGLDVERAAPVLGTTRDIGLLLRNLIDNAIRYTPEGGTVRVAVTTVGGDAELTVRDSGVGIPSKDLPRIFERFYRVDRARSRETGGTGLGLAIVKHVAENLAARVDVESELGVGTTFTVRIPLAS